MKVRKAMFVLTAGLVVAGLAVAVPTLGQTGRRALPTQTRIISVSKVVRGQQRKVADVLYACPNGAQTRVTDYEISAPLVSGPCDEPCSKPLLNGTFRALVRVTRRENLGQSNRGCFVANTWRIVNASGVVVAYGTMRGTVVAGTHNIVSPTATNCEPCAPPRHFEGTLDGQAVLQQCRGPICASIQGIGLDPNMTTFDMRIEGSMTVPCAQILGTQLNAPGESVSECGACGS